MDVEALTEAVRAELRPERNGARLVVDFRRDRFVYREDGA